MIGGPPGGGSTTTAYQLNGTMNLYYMNTTTMSYQSVPSAYDFGTDTGETSEGVNVYWHGTTAYLGVGPSLLYGMWGLNDASLHTFSGQITPPNTFMFVNTGSTFNETSAAYVPLTVNGDYRFTVPSTEITGQLLLSDYTPPVNFTVQSMTTQSVQFSTQLTMNMSAGIYTPLIAMTNSQLKYISISGNGTLSNPYVLFNNPMYMVGTTPYTVIDPIFGESNDYLFPPVFPGVFLWGTTDYVDMNMMPVMLLNYSLVNVPITTQMNYQFFMASNFTLYDSMANGLFLDSFVPFSIYGENVTHALFDSNYIYTSGVLFYNPDPYASGGLYLLNSTDNVIWHNVFLPFSGLVGLWLLSSGNLIYNNGFLSYFTAINPPAPYMNTWNVTLEPASAVMVFNGYTLTGT
ncbi:thermopsin family protease [Thermogymnomonas acidicola]|uniref:thermopsin family protease n=1 Tax=Thermogymnomonas acidicola TaxID=399579 RepID=UPI00094642CA|nr:thermopsin family protease [Thermogymnomonas acidicola]